MHVHEDAATNKADLSTEQLLAVEGIDGRLRLGNAAESNESVRERAMNDEK